MGDPTPIQATSPHTGRVSHSTARKKMCYVTGRRVVRPHTRTPKLSRFENCHIETKNVPKWVRCPNPVPSIVPPVSKVKRLDFKVEFHQNGLDFNTRTTFGVAHLTCIPFDLRTSKIHQRGPTICHIETKNVPKWFPGPKSSAFHLPLCTSHFLGEKPGFSRRISPQLAGIPQLHHFLHI